MARLFITILLFTTFAACTPPKPPEFTAPPGSMAPELNVGGDGRVYLSWLEPAGAGHALRFAVYGDGGWSGAKTVAQGENWFANWADFPGVTALGGDTLAAFWLQRRGDIGHAYDIALTFSRDDGKTWDAPITPHDDGTETEHGFVTLLPTPEHHLSLVWLDGRNMAGHDEASAEAHSAMTLRFAEYDRHGKLMDASEIDTRTCSCCQTSAVNTPGGPLVAYRDRTEDEIRDIVVMRRSDGRWQAPRSVAEDGWRIEACPVNGPSLDAREQNVVAAWFSGADNQPKVQVAFSSDGGQVFGKAMRVNAGSALGRVDVALIDEDSALVSWVELAGEQAQVVWRVARRDGSMSMPEILIHVDPSRLSGFPRMVRRGDEVLMAWTEGDAKRRQVRAVVRPTRTLGP